MVDVAAIAGTISALKGASDIAKAMIGLRDAQAMQTKVIELNNQILAPQDSAFAAREESTALIARIGELEKEVTRLKDWEADKKRYQLTNIGGGVVALALKESMGGCEPPHYLCADCAANGKKAYLQPQVTGPYYDKFKCGFEIGIDKGTPPIRPSDPEPYF
jgi:hypothetical protein